MAGHTSFFHYSTELFKKATSIFKANLLLGKMPSSSRQLPNEQRRFAEVCADHGSEVQLDGQVETQTVLGNKTNAGISFLTSWPIHSLKANSKFQLLRCQTSDSENLGNRATDGSIVEQACDVMVISPGRRTCAAFCENRGLRCLNAWVSYSFRPQRLKRS